MKKLFLILLLPGCVTTSYTDGKTTIERTAFWYQPDIEIVMTPESLELKEKQTTSEQLKSLLEIIQ